MTRESYERSEFVGKTFEVKIKLRASPTPGDYKLGFAAGAAPVTAAGRPDPARVEWAAQDGRTITNREITFK